jgi:hypothetical protein
MSLKFIAALLYFSAPERWSGTTALDRDDQLIVKTRACTRLSAFVNGVSDGL